MVLSFAPVSLYANTTQEGGAVDTTTLGASYAFADDAWYGAETVTDTYMPTLMIGEILGLRVYGTNGIYLYDASSDNENINTLDTEATYEVKVRMRPSASFTSFRDDATVNGTYADGTASDGKLVDAFGISYRINKSESGSGCYSRLTYANWNGLINEITQTFSWSDFSDTTKANITDAQKMVLNIAARGPSYGKKPAQYAPMDVAGVSVVKHYKVVDDPSAEEPTYTDMTYTVYEWGSYNGDWTPTNIGRTNTATLMSSASTPSGEVVTTTSTYVPTEIGETYVELGQTLAAGTYTLGGSFWTGANSGALWNNTNYTMKEDLTVTAYADEIELGSFTVGKYKEADEITFVLDEDTDVENISFVMSIADDATYGMPDNLFIENVVLTQVGGRAELDAAGDTVELMGFGGATAVDTNDGNGMLYVSPSTNYAYGFTASGLCELEANKEYTIAFDFYSPIANHGARRLQLFVGGVCLSPTYRADLGEYRDGYSVANLTDGERFEYVFTTESTYDPDAPQTEVDTYGLSGALDMMIIGTGTNVAYNYAPFAIDNLTVVDNATGKTVVGYDFEDGVPSNFAKKTVLGDFIYVDEVKVWPDSLVNSSTLSSVTECDYVSVANGSSAILGDSEIILAPGKYVLSGNFRAGDYTAENLVTQAYDDDTKLNVTADYNGASVDLKLTYSDGTTVTIAPEERVDGELDTEYMLWSELTYKFDVDFETEGVTVTDIEFVTSGYNAQVEAANVAIDMSSVALECIGVYTLAPDNMDLTATDDGAAQAAEENEFVRFPSVTYNYGVRQVTLIDGTWEVGTTYQITFDFRNNSDKRFNLRRFYSTLTANGGVTTAEIGDYASRPNVYAEDGWVTVTVEFTPTTAAPIRFGFSGGNFENAMSADIDNAVLSVVTPVDESSVYEAGQILVSTNEAHKNESYYVDWNDVKDISTPSPAEAYAVMSEVVDYVASDAGVDGDDAAKLTYNIGNCLVFEAGTYAITGKIIADGASHERVAYRWGAQNGSLRYVERDYNGVIITANVVLADGTKIPATVTSSIDAAEAAGVYAKSYLGGGLTATSYAWEDVKISFTLEEDAYVDSLELIGAGYDIVADENVIWNNPTYIYNTSAEWAADETTAASVLTGGVITVDDVQTTTSATAFLAADFALTCDHVAGKAVIENKNAGDCQTLVSYESVVYCEICGEEISRVTVDGETYGDHSYVDDYCEICGMRELVIDEIGDSLELDATLGGEWTGKADITVAANDYIHFARQARYGDTTNGFFVGDGFEVGTTYKISFSYRTYDKESMNTQIYVQGAGAEGADLNMTDGYYKPNGQGPYTFWTDVGSSAWKTQEFTFTPESEGTGYIYYRGLGQRNFADWDFDDIVVTVVTPADGSPYGEDQVVFSTLDADEEQDYYVSINDVVLGENGTAASEVTEYMSSADASSDKTDNKLAYTLANGIQAAAGNYKLVGNFRGVIASCHRVLTESTPVDWKTYLDVNGIDIVANITLADGTVIEAPAKFANEYTKDAQATVFTSVEFVFELDAAAEIVAVEFVGTATNITIDGEIVTYGSSNYPPKFDPTVYALDDVTFENVDEAFLAYGIALECITEDEANEEFVCENHLGAPAVVENEDAGNCVTLNSYETVVYCQICGEELSRTTVTGEEYGNHSYADGACVHCAKVDPDVEYTLDEIGESVVMDDTTLEGTVKTTGDGNSYLAVSNIHNGAAGFVTNTLCQVEAGVTYTVSYKSIAGTAQARTAHNVVYKDETGANKTWNPGNVYTLDLEPGKTFSYSFTPEYSGSYSFMLAGIGGNGILPNFAIDDLTITVESIPEDLETELQVGQVVFVDNFDTLTAGRYSGKDIVGKVQKYVTFDIVTANDYLAVAEGDTAMFDYNVNLAEGRYTLTAKVRDLVFDTAKLVLYTAADYEAAGGADESNTTVIKYNEFVGDAVTMSTIKENYNGVTVNAVVTYSDGTTVTYTPDAPAYAYTWTELSYTIDVEGGATITNVEFVASGYNVVDGEFVAIENAAFELCDAALTFAGEIECEHEAGETVIENAAEANCSTLASYDEVVYCSICGDEMSRTTVTGEVYGDHVAGDAVRENEQKGTCIATGSYDEVVYCSLCGEEISRVTTPTELGDHNYVDGECTVCFTPDPDAVPDYEVIDGFEVQNVTNDTATVTDPAIGWIVGENTFNVDCDSACRVFVSHDGGLTYTRLTATENVNGGYDFTTELTAESTIVVRLYGDINGNGRIAPNDYTLAKNIYLDSTYETAVLNKMLLDYNGDGRITVDEITLVRRAALGQGIAW